MTLILASQSPRRKELLEIFGIPFRVISADIDESLYFTENINDSLIACAQAKAHAIQKEHPNATIIAADTVIVFHDQMIGKPKDEADAIATLKLLSGQSHTVKTALVIISPQETVQRVVDSTVSFIDLDESMILDYVASKEPLDKAGAYHIGGKGAAFIRHIDGDYSAICGLPLSIVYETIIKKRSEY